MGAQVLFFDARRRRLHREMLTALRLSRERPQTWEPAWRRFVSLYGEESTVEVYHHLREYMREQRS